MYDENQVDPAEDNIRIYVPLDLNHDSILRKLYHLYDILGEPDDNNEMDFYCGVSRIFEQLDIYNRVWFTRNGSSREPGLTGIDYLPYQHSEKGRQLALDIVKVLREHEGCAEKFPYDEIAELDKEYQLKILDI